MPGISYVFGAFPDPGSDYQLAFKPHIFIVSADAVYARHMSAYGYSRKTSPHLEKFAEEAVLFKNFYSASSATSMAVGALFSGEYIGNYSGDFTGGATEYITHDCNREK